MRFKVFVDFALQMWLTGQPLTLCLLGKPGIGKTAAARALAQAMTTRRKALDPSSGEAKCWVVDLSSCLPEDINGLPFRVEVDGQPVTRYAPQNWLAELCQPDAYGVLCLDDLPAASPAVQVASRQISLERRVHEAKLAPGIVVIVTGNRREDKSNASTLPAHFRNSVVLLDIEVDGVEWVNWAGSQVDIDPIIGSFLAWKPGLLSKTPADADARGAFATPRTWAMLGRVYKQATAQNVLTDVAHGLVGEGVGSEFLAFDKLRSSLIDPKIVLRDPKGALPNPAKVLDSPDKLVAMTTALAEHTVMILRDDTVGREVKKKLPYSFLKAVSWVTAHNREHVATAVSTYASNGGPVQLIAQAVKENPSDEDLRPLMEFLARAFK